jgi:hypothetical protein
MSFLTHPIKLLGDVGHVESRFSPLETVLVSVQDRCIVCAAQKSFWTHPMVLLLDKAQDRCTVSSSIAKARKSFLTHQMDLQVT